MNPKASPNRSDLDDSIFTLNYFVYVKTWLSFKKQKGCAYLPYSRQPKWRGGYITCQDK